MKEIILLSVWCCIFGGFVSAQGKVTTIEVKEVKAIHNTYIVKKLSSGDMYIENKTDSLRSIPSNELYDPLPAKLSDDNALDRLTKKYITVEIIKQKINPLIDKNEAINIELIADKTGKLKEMAVSFPIRWNIPITVIEEYMTAVLNSGLTYECDRNHPSFKEAKWIGHGATYNFKMLMEL